MYLGAFRPPPPPPQPPLSPLPPPSPTHPTPNPRGASEDRGALTAANLRGGGWGLRQRALPRARAPGRGDPVWAGEGSGEVCARSWPFQDEFGRPLETILGTGSSPKSREAVQSFGQGLCSFLVGGGWFGLRNIELVSEKLSQYSIGNSLVSFPCCDRQA